MSTTSSPDVNTSFGSTNFYSCLALDLASQTGWAIADEKGKITGSGTFVLEGDDCEKLAMLASNLHHMGGSDIKAVVIERPLYLSRPNAAFLMRLSGVAMAAAGKWGAEFFEYAPATVKKAVTGDGHATKETVMRFVQRLTGRKVASDDESDACAVLLTHLNRAKRGKSEHRAHRRC